MVTQTQTSKCYVAAMRMLVRREHSCLELTQKLSLKEFDVDDISKVIDLLIEQNYQSDVRFASDFIQMRFNQGKGPVKISLELKQRGIENFDLSDYDWFSLAKEIRQNKFSDEMPSEYKQQATQKRFLQSRGFDFEQINFAFDNE